MSIRLGLVEVRETVRTETHPDRIIYAITDAGRDIAHDWLRQMLSTAGEDYPDFIAALSILFGLPPDDARRQLELRAEKLAARLADSESELTANPHIPRLFLLEEEYRRAILAAELDWLRSVIDDLRVGRITWNEEWLRGIAAANTPPAHADDN
jgi:hypothetical protein